jgi:hypothetical protein
VLELRRSRFHSMTIEAACGLLPSGVFSNQTSKLIMPARSQAAAPGNSPHFAGHGRFSLDSRQGAHRVHRR